MVENEEKTFWKTQQELLSGAGIENSRFELKVLAEEALGRRIDTSILPDLTPAQKQQIEKQVHERMQGVPLQYIIGNWEFYGRTFLVGPGALIPRGDTEILIGHVLERSKFLQSLVIADLGAGTGCIGITLGKTLKNAQVYLLEKSQQAGGYCKKNIERILPEAKLLLCDFLNPPKNLPRFDLVVSNPPYIKSEEISCLQKEVRCEPHEALDGGADGLFFYREIARIWKENILPGGVLAFEVGYDQAEDVAEILQKNGYLDIRMQKDYQGFFRAVSAVKP